MVLQIAADDSGNEPPAKVFVFGGFVADAETWSKFSDAWDTALKEHPRIEYFKMSDANALCGEFRGWTPEAKDAKVEALSYIAAKYPLAVIDVSIKHTDFAELISGIDLPARGLSTDKPYPILANQLMVTLGRYQRRVNASDKIDLFFDRQLGYEEELHLWWPLFEQLRDEETKTNFARYISGPPIFKNEEEFVPIQAADMYVWHKRRHLEGNENIFNPRPPILRRLCDGKWRCSLAIGREVLSEVRASLLRQLDDFVAANPDVQLLGAGRKARKKSRPKPPKPRGS